MALIYRYDCSGIDWKVVPEILKTVGMGYTEPALHRKAFENSHTVIFVYDGDRLIGFSRAISDGAYQAAIYDVAILPEYQNHGIGRQMMQTIRDRLPGCNFILFAKPEAIDFYRRLGFGKMNTGMALFVKQELMREKGFID